MIVDEDNDRTVAILQTGRLGDLWFTLPLARNLDQKGYDVEIYYDAHFGNPFRYAPYVRPRPVRLPFSHNRIQSRPWDLGKQAVNQLQLYAKVRIRRQYVIWNELFPWHLWSLMRRNLPYPVQWYQRHPGVNFRTASTTLVRRNDRTILLMKSSSSLSFERGAAFDTWIEENLRLLVAATGYTPIHVMYGDEKPHPHCRSWYGSLDEYQQLIAGAGIVFGVSTSAHVLGQLLGKPIVALYPDQRANFVTIGEEDAALHPYALLSDGQLARIVCKCEAPA